MKVIFKGGSFFDNGKFKTAEFVSAVVPSFQKDLVLDISGCVVFPGFADVHVHLREPGFSYKETIASGTEAALRGGYTALCAMPNLSPVPDCLKNLEVQRQLIEQNARVRVYPYGAITLGRGGKALAAMDELAPYVIAFSDDGSGVQDEAMMRAAMEKAKKFGKIIAAHCEEEALLGGGYIHQGEYARLHGHRGICSESEWRPLERDLRLAAETGCQYHVCHVSSKESVALIRKAKAAGIDVTAETAPHYLLMNDSMLQEEGRFKMNPPVRGEEDRLALIEGLRDGTIDMIATDHAPNAAEEKNKGLEKSAMGVVGLETAFPVLYTGLVEKGLVSLERLIDAMCVRPRQRFPIEGAIGDTPDLCVADIANEYVLDSRRFASKGKATPFDGMRVKGKIKLTMVKGEIVWNIIGK